MTPSASSLIPYTAPLWPYYTRLPGIRLSQMLSSGYLFLIRSSMPSLAPSPPTSTLSVSDGQSPSHGCPATTVKPDANGWVPPGTCGYLSRPYYPSFVTALVFSAAAAAVLVGYALMIARVARRRRGRLPEENAPVWRGSLLPWTGALISTCLLAAYILRAFGTRYQQVPGFVAFSDMFVLVCPICQSFHATLFSPTLTPLQNILPSFPPKLSAYVGTDYTPCLQ